MAASQPDAPRFSVLSYIAFWQFLAFAILLCLIWVSELMDLPAMFYGAAPTQPDYIQACLLSAAVLLCAIIAVGHTYLQQRHILKGMLVVCSTCGKVRLESNLWEDLGRFIETKTLATFRRNVCPACLDRIEEEITQRNTREWKTGEARP